MAILSFVVAAESLIDVIIVGALVVQRTERGVAFVGKHIGTAAVIRTHRRFLTVRVNRIFGIDQQLLDANMAALIHPERVAGKPGFQLVDIRDRTVTGCSTFQNSIGKPRIIDVQRLAARMIDRDVIHHRNFCRDITVALAELQKESDVVVSRF